MISISVPKGFNCHDITDSHNSTIVDCYGFVGSSVYRVSSSGKTSPRFLRKYESGDCKATEHAEMGILKKIPKRVNPSRIRILTIRYSKGRISNSKPCAFCQIMLESRGIKPRNIEYYDWNGNRKKLKNWTYREELKEEFPC